MKANIKDTTLKIRISTDDKQKIKDTAHTQQKTISEYVRGELVKTKKPVR